jgi:hypothetical protein
MKVHLPLMEVNSIRSVVEAAIQRASAATGVDFSFLMGTAKRESGYNPGAKAGSSSAAGLFQFTEQTWLSTLKQHGAKYGYARYAQLIDQTSDGRYRVANGDARKMVMDLRLDAHASASMAAELASGNASYLRGRVGRDPTSGELYAAHFLGPQGSAQLIQAVKATPHAQASTIFPDAARANPAIFHRDGRPASVSEVYADLTSTGGGTAVAAAPETAIDTAAEQKFIHYAGGRTADRVEQQRQLVDLVLRGSLDPDGISTASNEGSGSGGITDSLFNTAMLRAAAYGARKRG